MPIRSMRAAGVVVGAAVIAFMAASWFRGVLPVGPEIAFALQAEKSDVHLGELTVGSQRQQDFSIENLDRGRAHVIRALRLNCVCGAASLIRAGEQCSLPYELPPGGSVTVRASFDVREGSQLVSVMPIIDGLAPQEPLTLVAHYMGVTKYVVENMLSDGHDIVDADVMIPFHLRVRRRDRELFQFNGLRCNAPRVCWYNTVPAPRGLDISGLIQHDGSVGDYEIEIAMLLGGGEVVQHKLYGTVVSKLKMLPSNLLRLSWIEGGDVASGSIEISGYAPVSDLRIVPRDPDRALGIECKAVTQPGGASVIEVVAKRRALHSEGHVAAFAVVGAAGRSLGNLYVLADCIGR